jgi:hypothetical protein
VDQSLTGKIVRGIVERERKKERKEGEKWIRKNQNAKG